jgi:type IV secretory pathway VirB4 component
MSPTSKATQDFVPIEEVRDGIVVLKDGSLRAILMASSINFALKSVDEQTSILLQFQSFLNSLDFPMQIFIQSRNLDIRPYTSLLEERRKAQTNDLMKIQVSEYIEFVKSFTENANIMTKNFFIVVPYTSSIFTSKKGVMKDLLSFGGKKKKGDIKEQNNTFEENRTQLEQRLSVVEQGLTRTGIRVAPLGTEETIELFYKIFNPGELDRPIPLNEMHHGSI